MADTPTQYPQGLSEEDLMAYADEALPQEDMARITALIEANPHLQAEVATFRLTRNTLQEAYSEKLDDSIPEHLRALVAGDAPEREDTVVPFSARPTQRGSAQQTSRWQAPQWQAMAASLMLVVGGVLGWGVAQTGGADTGEHPSMLLAGPLQPDHPLTAALETASSAQTVAMTGGEFHAVQSFQAIDESYCREFEFGNDTAAAVGIACRADDAWRVEAVFAAAPRERAGDGFVLASGFDESAVNAVLDTLGAGVGFGADAEACLIEAGWEKTANCGQ